jgi:hypothetical protein
LTVYSKKLANVLAINQTLHPSGFGRVDAIGSIANETLSHDLNYKENFVQNNAPVSYPHLWDTPFLEKVQWSGNVENPFGRNIGQVMGVFGDVNLQDEERKFESSIQGENLYNLHQMLKDLKSPPWPEFLFGDLDAKKVAAGRVIYETPDHQGQRCAGCHFLPDEQGNLPKTDINENMFGHQFIKVTLVPVEQIGTDENATQLVFSKHLLKTLQVGEWLELPEELGGTEFATEVIVGIAQELFDYLNLDDSQKAALSGFRFYAEGYEPEPDFAAYKARPLNGVWATAPFLHNGSVRTLAQLLVSPPKREQQFWIGSYDFDPQTVGFESIEGLDHQVFDATVSGNLAKGHDYGTRFSDYEKSQLIEFLKSL